MKTFILLVMLLCSHAFGALSTSDLALIGQPKNYMLNGGAERGTTGCTTYSEIQTATFNSGGPRTSRLTSGTGYAVNQRVLFTAATIPTGFTAGTTYYVASVSTNVINVSTTLGGSAATAFQHTAPQLSFTQWTQSPVLVAPLQT